MNDYHIGSSIKFRSMFAENTSRSDKNIKVQPQISSLFDFGAYPEKENMGLVTLQLVDFHLKFTGIGLESGLQCLEICLDEAVTHFRACFPECTLVVIQEASPGDYLMIFDRAHLDHETLYGAYLAYRTAVVRAASGRVQILTGVGMELLVGFADLDQASYPTLGKALFPAMCKAKRLAQQRIHEAVYPSRPELSSILAEGLTGVVYQPVVDLSNGSILGWEAFARSQSGVPILDTLKLYELTGSTHKALELERGLWRLALAGVGKLERRQKLFINVSPTCLADPNYHPEEFVKLVEEYGLEPHHIVLEFSEKSSPGELATLPDRLDAYRSHKFLTAIDDVGAGNCNLMLLTRLRPDFIKADVSLMRDIESNPLKRVMIETLVLMAEKTRAWVIAEGVETELALSSLVSMGVHAGQGYHLAQPCNPKPEGPFQIPPKASYGQASIGEWKCSAPVGELTKPCLIVEADDFIQNVKNLLADKPPMSCVVVVDCDKPTGLLMNYNLDKTLSTKFGLDLYSKKLVTRLMDENPLCVEADMPIEVASRLAMNREACKIYDDIIVTRDGSLAGTVSVQQMLDTLAKVQVELAKGSNPLTGLPGNVAIENEFNRRAKESVPSSLIYIDLDNFKVYNDVYGFNQGDKVLLLTAQVLRDAIASVSAKDFIGHVGGDDFVIISAKDRSETICRQIIETFSVEAPRLYTPDDRKKGCIKGKNREGVEQCFPLLTMSICILDCDFQTLVTFEELSHRVAEMKKIAKAQPGNSCVRDRRVPLGTALITPGHLPG
jgi:EAL domain-containing protein (putative c-di-GMP-specific phosphodiesterase class I)/GGDEF domain-containing protein/CBS domain-containing protein